MKTIQIGSRLVGEGHPCFVIAEAGVNHNGDVAMALALVDAAREAGADAVKFQTFRTERVMTRDAPKATYQKSGLADRQSQYDLIKGLELPSEAFRQIRDHARAKGFMFLSTPFDAWSVDLLVAMDVPAFKIPSGEIVNPRYLEKVAATGRPVIMSTGMATLEEVDNAVRLLERRGCGSMALLHCVSSYPADPRDMNIRAMDTLRETFGYPAGLSDHSEGIEVSLAAVARGASVIEKHLTLDKTLPGPDQQASLDAGEFKQLVAGIRKVEMALGDGCKRPVESERDTADVARRSLVAACAIPEGTTITDEMIDVLRPGTGLPPSALPEVLGRKARRPIEKDELILPGMFE
ncbi:MAG: N-acetylneuraminate synthase [Phycisphaerae bacterium]|nr:N-acetylneuraminate synthase [Phycisphaerae bacterium]